MNARYGVVFGGYFGMELALIYGMETNNNNEKGVAKMEKKFFNIVKIGSDRLAVSATLTEREAVACASSAAFGGSHFNESFYFTVKKGDRIHVRAAEESAELQKEGIQIEYVFEGHRF
jgi:hypothetical protein